MQSTWTNLIHSLKTHCFNCVKQLYRLRVIFYLREFCSLDTNSIESFMSWSNWCHKSVWIYYYYAVMSILSQSDDEDQWHLITFWFRMMINVERNYEMHDQKLLVIVVMFKHWWHYVKNNYYIIEVLTDHNNLKSFMNIQKLNEKQVRWIMRLSICNFEITHKLERTNLINASLRWFDYKNKNIFANHLLLTLQRKLTRIESLNSFIFIAIKELYCIWVINDVEKTFIYSISMNRYSAEYVESRL